MNNCEIVKDLIPLCVDDVASKSSVDFVNEHISTCTECRKEMENMKGSLRIPVNTNQQLQGAKPFEKMSKLLTNRIIKASVISVLVVVLAFVGFVAVNRVVFPVDVASNANFYIKNDKVMLEYTGPGDVLYSINSVYVDEEPTGPIDTTIVLSQTFWERFIVPLYDKGNDVYFIGRSEKIARIYTEDGTLLWENPDIQ